MECPGITALIIFSAIFAYNTLTQSIGMIYVKNLKKKVLAPHLSSYHGKVHIPNITTTKHISLGYGITLNSGCPNHAVVNGGSKDGYEL